VDDEVNLYRRYDLRGLKTIRKTYMKLIFILGALLCSLLVVDKSFKEPFYSERDTLAAIINSECSNCSETEMFLVGSVVLNRANSDEFPNDVRSVVRQPSQFAGYKTRHYYPTKKTRKVADQLLNGMYLTPCIIFFHTHKSKSNMDTVIMYADHHLFGK
jgi:hypothetical protein